MMNFCIGIVVGWFLHGCVIMIRVKIYKAKTKGNPFWIGGPDKNEQGTIEIKPR